MAKGGACVARLGDSARVVFVRGGVPGETCRIEVTDDSRRAWWRGRVVEVLRPSPDRVTPPCPVAGRCGGCDWQHIGLDRQRRLKSESISGQLRHLAGLDASVSVSAVPGDVGGLAWRTRMRYVGDGAAVGLRAPFSHDIVPLPSGGCPLAAPGGPEPRQLMAWLRGTGEIAVTVSESGTTVWSPQRGVISGEAVVKQSVAGRAFAVRADGFWQVHPGAGEVLTGAMIEALRPRPGESALDLYCGVGLFTATLADAGVRVTGVEVNTAAAALARFNVPTATIVTGRVERAEWTCGDAVDLVVLDPPRAGAGAAVVRRVAAVRPRAIAYIACDEAALARDVATFASVGYRLTGIEAFDMFPMTAHVECVVRLQPDEVDQDG